MKRRAAIAAFFGIGAAFLAAGASAAWADVKVVSEQTLTGMEDWGFRSIPIKTTRYFKGDMMREEYEGRNVIHIYDSKNDKYYTINRSNETYAVQTLDEVTVDAAGGLSKLAVEGKVDIADSGNTQKILKLPAKSYTVTAHLVIKTEQSNLKVVDVKMQSEQWTTGAVALPSTNPRLIRAAYLISTNAHKLFKPFYDKVGEFKGLPLSFDHILSFQAAPGMTVNGAQQGTIEAHGTVQSVSTAKLPEALFHVPKGYKLVPHIDLNLD